jgi:hypothetical protein
MPAEVSVCGGKTRLGRDVYITLAAVGWADGKTDPDRRTPSCARARRGLELADIAEIEEATKKPVDIGIVDQNSKKIASTSTGYRRIAKMDGVVTEGESSALGKLAGALKIPERPREIVMKIVEDIASSSGDNRPARYDLSELRRVIGERLKAAQAKRGES